MTKKRSVKKNLKTHTRTLLSQNEKDLLQNSSISEVDWLILNNVVIWEKPTEWFWEFVRTLNPSTKLPLSPEVATNIRGTRFSTNERNRPRRGKEIPYIGGTKRSAASCLRKNALYFVATQRAEVATRSYPGKEGDSLPVGSIPVVTGHAQERNL